jgi:hypothetical protein
VNLLVRRTASGKRVIPLPDEERDRMLAANTAQHHKGRIYVEIPPAAEPVVPRKAAVYATKVMTPEGVQPKSNRKGA